MDDRGCKGRMACKHCPVLPAISILPSGSLATSFTKPIPQWDELGHCRCCCYVFNQRKKTRAIMISTVRRVSIIFFCFPYSLCVRVFAQVRNKDTKQEEKRHWLDHCGWAKNIDWRDFTDQSMYEKVKTITCKGSIIHLLCNPLISIHAHGARAYPSKHLAEGKETTLSSCPQLVA